VARKTAALQQAKQALKEASNTEKAQQKKQQKEEEKLDVAKSERTGMCSTTTTDTLLLD
jgi:hypothetical protein